MKQDEILDAEVIDNASEKGGALAISQEDALAVARETYELIPYEERYPELYTELQALAETGDVEALLDIQDKVSIQITDNRQIDNRQIDNSVANHNTTVHYQPFVYNDYSQQTTILWTDNSDSSDHSVRNSHNRRTSSCSGGNSEPNHQLWDFILVLCGVCFCIVLFSAAYNQYIAPSRYSPTHMRGWQ